MSQISSRAIVRASVLALAALAATTSNASAAGKPIVSVPAAPVLDSAGVMKLSAKVVANGFTAKALIEYGLSTTYTDTSAVQTINPSATLTFTALTKQYPVGTTVHYRVRANNTTSIFFGGTSVTADATFVVPAAPPVVTGGLRPLAAQTGPHDFWLRGKVQADQSTTTRIEYGPTTAYGTSVAAAAVPSRTTSEVSVKVPTPATGSTINYRTVATSPAGTTYGANQVFTVPAGVVRSLYMYPTDRPLKPAYRDAVSTVVRDVQAFYLAQTGKTFTYAEPITCALPNTSSYYGTEDAAGGSWTKLEAALAACGVSNHDLYSDIVAYADIPGTCNDRIGAGRPIWYDWTALTFMGDSDLQGLTGVTGIMTRGCDGNPPSADLHNGVESFKSGAAHEIGHTFGLAHPYDQGGACYQQASTTLCDKALMQFGWMDSLGSTYLLPADKTKVSAYPFLT